MNILNLRPSAAGGCLATFDIEVAPGLRLTSWQLRRSQSGQWRTFCPSARNGTPAAIIAPEIHDTITAAAVAAFGGQAPNDPID